VLCLAHLDLDNVEKSSQAVPANDGLERLSKKQLPLQSLTASRKPMSPFCLQAHATERMTFARPFGWSARGREFESRRPDHIKTATYGQTNLLS
jgi:hypothetical protein